MRIRSSVLFSSLIIVGIALVSFWGAGEAAQGQETPIVAKATTLSVTVNFDDLEIDDATDHRHGRVYGGIGRNPNSNPFVGDACAGNAQGCFILIAHHFSPVSNPAFFGTFGIQAIQYPGSAALFHQAGEGEIVLTRIDSGTFDLKGISLAEHPSTGGGLPILSPPWDITFYGKKRNGRVVSEVVRVLNSASPLLELEDFQFRRLNDVVSVSWFNGGGASHQFDDILVETLVR